MGRRVAIVLRGPPGSGKSTVSAVLQSMFGLPVNSHVELDRYWAVGEKRYAGCCRYWDLRNQADVLIIQLGFGEPAEEKFFGATKNPREWISILESDSREIYFFLLSISESESRRRVALRCDLSDGYVLAAHARYAPGGVCSSAAFCERLGTSYSEDVIDTETCVLAETVVRIVTKVGSLS